MSPLDATAMAAAVRAGTTTAEELTDAALARIDAWDGAVNAFTVVLRDEALARAREIDEGLARDPSAYGPLAGVPVSVKDHIWMAGQPATNGSLALRDFVPDVDAVPVARLRAAGAVIVGKTNNPEFCYRGYTDNAVHGLTRNPWSLDRTPGGSSGGAGASVAYAATPLARGHRRRRLDPDPVGVLRSGGSQADVRPGAQAARLPRLAHAVGRRAARRLGPRPPAGAASDGRGAPGRPAVLAGRAG